MVKVFLNSIFFKRLTFLIAIGIPLALMLSWHLRNSVYPNDDGADYFRVAQHTYLSFQTQGFWDGLASLYFQRGWRPIFFPNLAVPFLWLSDGDIKTTVVLTMAFCFLLLLTYVYLLASEYVSPFRAMLSTLFVANTYWILSSTHYFYSEIFLYAISMAFLYHLKKSEFFSVNKHAWFLGFFLGVGIISKPAPLLMSLGLFLLVYIFLSNKKKNIVSKDISFSIFLILTLVLFIVFIAAYFKPVPHDLSILSIVFFVFVILFSPLIVKSKDKKLPSPFVVSVCVCSLISAVWWVPSFRSYAGYAFDAAIAMAAKNAQYKEMGFGEAFISFFSTLGGYPLAFLMLMAVPIFFTKQEPTIHAKGFNLSFFMVIMFAVIALPTFVMSLTPSPDPRRASLSYLVIIFLISVMATHQRYYLPKLRIGIMMFLCMFQIFTNSVTSLGFYSPAFTKLNQFFPAVQGPVEGDTDPSEKTFLWLYNLSYRTESIATSTLTLSSLLNAYRERPFNHQALQMLAEKYGTDLSFNFPWDFDNLREGYRQLAEMADMVLLDVTTKAPEHIYIDEPHDKLTSDLIDRWEKNTLQEVGLSLIPNESIVVKNKVLVLLKVVR